MSSSQGTEDGRGSVLPPTSPAPLSPFGVDGLCRHCRGLGEHFSSCIYAREWEKFGGGL